MTDACRVCPARFVDEATRVLGTSLGDLVPPEAQRHLLNAQRELLLAVAAMIEHHTQTASAAEPSPAGTRGRGGKRTRGDTGRSRRPAPVELE
ncbi:MAG: hypothetical protein QOE18_609 [Chloroflexota bacterium]|jgi:hypothetical protein|nr:hypothetical protein [Chloroflexota bacterium]